LVKEKVVYKYFGGSPFSPENGGSRFLWNISFELPSYAQALHVDHAVIGDHNLKAVVFHFCLFLLNYHPITVSECVGI